MTPGPEDPRIGFPAVMEGGDSQQSNRQARRSLQALVDDSGIQICQRGTPVDVVGFCFVASVSKLGRCGQCAKRIYFLISSWQPIRTCTDS